MSEKLTKARRVTVVPWGEVDNPEKPIRWGLKVDKMYVCRVREVLLFDTRGEAMAEGKCLRAVLSDDEGKAG